MKILVTVVALFLGGCFTTQGPVVTWPGVTTPPPVTSTPRMNLAETERYYQACMTAVGKLLGSGQVTAGSANARALGNVIVKARFALDKWHLEPSNSVYERDAKIAINDLAGLIRANGGNVNGSWG